MEYPPQEYPSHDYLAEAEGDDSENIQESDPSKPAKINLGTPFYPKRAASYGGLQNSRWAPRGQYRAEKDNTIYYYGGGGRGGFRGGYGLGGGGGGHRPYRPKGGYPPPHPTPYYMDYRYNDWYDHGGPPIGGYYMDPQKPPHIRADKPQFKE